MIERSFLIVVDPEEPALMSTTVASHEIGAIRFVGSMLYTSSVQSPEWVRSYDATDALAVEDGPQHEVGDWVRGVIRHDGWSYRIVEKDVQIIFAEMQ